jgi:hypothetical protein
MIGTVVFNSAGGFIPVLAEVCLEALNVFQLPVAMNVYLTNPGQKVSAPPHTDKQDVFVLQMQGQKHWRVYAPPDPAKMPRADPFARGKATDILSFSELEAPLLDTMLAPGQLLYVPVGFPHTTDTFAIADEASVHLTLGIDTLIWGLAYTSLRTMATKLALIPDKHPLTRVNTEAFWRLQSALPVGFLAERITAPHKGTAVRLALETEIASKLLQYMREAEPSKYPATMSDEQLALTLCIQAIIPRALTHYAKITDTFGRMYYDVANKLSPAKLDLSYFRSMPYYQELERSMDAFAKWPDQQATAASTSSSSSSKVSKTGFRK